MTLSTVTTITLKPQPGSGIPSQLWECHAETPNPLLQLHVQGSFPAVIAALVASVERWKL